MGNIETVIKRITPCIKQVEIIEEQCVILTKDIEILNEANITTQKTKEPQIQLK